MNGRALFEVSERDIAFLRGEWESLTASYAGARLKQDALFESLRKRYSQKGRFYHNLSHVKALLALADSVKGAIRGYDEVRFSVWYHDAIYNTRKSDNEEKSARLAAEELEKLRAPAEAIGRVLDMILATRKHEAANYSEDTQIFLDIDLSILGAAEVVYQEYASSIRKEYAWVPAFMYRQARKRILNGFLDRPTLFFTKEMRRRF